MGQFHVFAVEVLGTTRSRLSSWGWVGFERRRCGFGNGMAALFVHAHSQHNVVEIFLYGIDA